MIVTADHETGNLYFDDAAGEYTFHSASHTGKNVPVFVYGAPDLFAEGAEMDNRDLPNLIASRLGWAERFPTEDPVPQTPAEEPSGGGEESPSGGSGKNLFRRIIEWLRNLFARIADWFRR